MRRPRLMSFLILLLLLVPATAHAGTCEEKCTLPTGDDKLKAFVKIDANSGRVLEGKTRFAADTQVQVVIVNQNPFKYTYRYQIEEREIEPTVIREALQLLGLQLDGESMPDPPPPPPPGAPAAAPAAADPGCPGMNTLFETAKASQTELLQTGQVVREALVAQEAHVKTLNDFSQEIENFLPRDEDSCEKLCGKGETVLPELEEFMKRADKEALEDFRKAKLAVSEATNILKLQVREGMQNLSTDQEREECNKKVTRYENQAKILLGIADASQKTFEENVKKIDALEKDVKAMRDVVKEVLDSDESFMYVTFLEARPAPTEFDITIIRQERGKETERRTTITIRTGRSRFSISSGIGVGFVEQRTFGRQQALVPTTMTQEDGTVVTGTGLGEIFAVTQESNESLVGVFQLNGLIRLGRKVSWGWALGATVGEGEGEASDLGYFTGPTLALIGDQLFFTLAYHQREVTELGGGFQAGDPVPEGFMGDLPLKTENEGGVLFTVTYRFR